MDQGIIAPGEQPPRETTNEDGCALIAYRVGGAPLRLVPASSSRAWMAATRGHYASRCLPMLLANQAGWFVLNSQKLVVVWDGGDEPSALRVFNLDAALPSPAISHFGSGILTWTIPYLFRTPPGYNLLVRGPANWPKDGAVALEGLVETDWSVASFTMNWQVTSVRKPVTFAVDEPICMLVPQKRGDLETFFPEIRGLHTDPALERAHEHWSRERAHFLTELRVPASEAAQRGWQKHYFQGYTTDGAAATEHQRKLHLRPFVNADTKGS